MTSYRVMYWHDIPYQIKAQDEQGIVKKILPPRFMQAINSAAIARQKYDNNTYMTGWNWSAKEYSESSAQEIASKLFIELDKRFSKEDLRQLILNHAKSLKVTNQS